MARLAALIDGYKRFYRKHFVEDSRLYDELSKGQSPKTLVIACSDSRVDPAIITDADPGDIFVVRNVANIVPPYQPEWGSYHGTSAALEFAINGVGVEHIVVLGHSGCAGIKALVDRPKDEVIKDSFVHSWITIVEDALKRGAEDDARDKYASCEQEAIHVSLKNLMTFPWVKEAVGAKKITLNGWYFSIDDGSLSTCTPDNIEFQKVEV